MSEDLKTKGDSEFMPGLRRLPSLETWLSSWTPTSPASSRRLITATIEFCLQLLRGYGHLNRLDLAALCCLQDWALGWGRIHVTSRSVASCEGKDT